MIPMLIPIKVRNQERVNRILDFLVKLFSFNDAKISVLHNDENFYKIICFDQLNKKCPFSLWINKVSGDKLFFNIGKEDKEATIFHFIDIDNDDTVSEVLSALHYFVESEVIESETYCRSNLKRVDYDLENGDKHLKYSYLHESYFFCFRREIKKKHYEKWLRL